MSKPQKTNRQSQLRAQRKAKRHAARYTGRQGRPPQHGSGSLSPTFLLSTYGPVPEFSRFFSCGYVQKLLLENGYINKDYRKSLWQTMGLFILSLVLTALTGHASLAHAQYEYQCLCASAKVKHASARTVERSVTQGRAFAGAMRDLANAFIRTYRKHIDALDFLSVGSAITFHLKQLGNIDKIRLSDGSEYRLAREVNEGDCKGKITAGRKIHASMDLNANSMDVFSIGAATSNERHAFILNTEEDGKDHTGCTLDLLDAAYDCDQVKSAINDRGDKYIMKAKFTSNPLVVRIARYDTVCEQDKLYKIGSKVSVKDLDKPVRLKNLIKDNEVVPYELVNNKIKGYCYDLLLTDGTRLILIYNPNNKSCKKGSKASSWVFFDTNLSAVFDIEAVASLYRLRWQIELMFLSHKSLGSIESAPDSNRHMGDAFVCAAIIAHVLKLYIAYEATNESLVMKHMQHAIMNVDDEAESNGISANLLPVSMQKAASLLGIHVYSWLQQSLNARSLVSEKVIFEQTSNISRIVASAVQYSRVSASAMASGKSIFATIEVVKRCAKQEDTG